MCHLLLFWTEAEDTTLFSLARGKEKNSSLFPLDLCACLSFFQRCIYYLNLEYLSGNCGELPFITSSLLFNCKSNTLGHYFSLLARGERKNSPLCALCNRQLLFTAIYPIKTPQKTRMKQRNLPDQNSTKRPNEMVNILVLCNFACNKFHSQ